MNLQIVVVVVMVELNPYIDTDNDDRKTPSDDGHLLHQVWGIAVEDNDEREIYVPGFESHPRHRGQKRVVQQRAEDFAPDVARVAELADGGVGEEDEVHEEESGDEIEQHPGATIAPELSEIECCESITLGHIILHIIIWQWYKEACCTAMTR